MAQLDTEPTADSWEVPSPDPVDWPPPTRPANRRDALAMTERWLGTLEGNRLQRWQIPWEAIPDAAPFPRRALLRSLATFQLGESGEGIHLRRTAERQSHPAYADAIDLFVAEEQEHARLLAEVLGRFERPLLDSHWSDRVFVTVRHFAGLRTEVLVLMAAELVALRYYALLARNARSAMVRSVAGQILDDEIRHVGFHCDHLAWGLGAWPPVLRSIVGRTWRSFLGVVAWVVAWDHRAVIRPSGQSLRRFVRDCAHCFDEAHYRIFESAT